MVTVGMGPLDALRSGTSIAADLMRLEDQGRVRSGNAADLLVVAGDPSKDITAASDRKNHRMIMKNGITVVGSLAAPEPKIARAAE